MARPGGVYNPTSLDFINRPNPVEPQSGPQRYPLNVYPQARHPPAGFEEYIRLLSGHEDHAAQNRPHKRRKSGGNAKSLDLPRLPVRPGAKRQRLPPTLSGLHQPPPDAGILPSISTDQPVAPVQTKPAEVSRPADVSTAQLGEGSVTDAPKPQNSPKQSAIKPKTKRRKWSGEETADLLKGVARFGIGNWTKILRHEDYSFQDRTALDLKDRFRVCCPDEYKRKSLPQKPRAQGSRSERKTQEELMDLGINEPFTKTERRKRTDYSAEEDAAILRGFQKYQNAWAEMKADESLGLGHRTATDLRDRMRNKYPKEFATLGLALRLSNSKKSSKEQAKSDREQSNNNGIVTKPADKSADKPLSLSNIVAPVDADTPAPPKPSQPSKQSQKLFPPFHDPYFGATFDHDDSDTEPITLDRDILDWPSDIRKHYSSTTDYSRSSGGIGIDPLATLNLPRPTAVPHSTTSQAPTVGAGTLPSVAAITAGSSFDYADDDGLQLPSLMFGPMYEGDGMRTSGPGHFLGIDELIS